MRQAELALVTARHDEYLAGALVLSAMGDLEARNLIEGVPINDPSDNFNRVSHSWGWVPWEPVVEVIDRAGAPPIGADPKNSAIAPGK